MMELKKIAVTGMALIVSMAAYADTANQASSSSSMGSPKSMMMQKKKRPVPFSDMSKAQQQKIKQIVDGMRLDMKQTISQLKQGRQGMSQFIMGGAFDEAKAKAYADAQGQLYAKMLYMRMKTRHDIYNVMTPAQQAQIQQSMKEREQRKQNKMKVNRIGVGQ